MRSDHIRDEVVSILASYGGKLVEFPYSADDKYKDIEARTRSDLAMPDIRRGRLKRVLEMKGLITAMEAHDGLTGLIVENTVVHQDGGAHQFDAMWVSSLCDSTAKGKPDIELVDMTSRFRTIEDITEVTTKPIIFDGDTGGKTEHFVYTVRSLERLGVSMVIIEDKTGLKKNSLFGTEVVQTQDTIENFSAKIRAGKKAQRTKEFMICARIESLILEQGMEDALTRAFAFAEAGADAIMIHSRKKDPSEIQEFIEKFREKDKTNVMGTVNLLQRAKEAWYDAEKKTWKEGKKYLQVSTDEVYGALGADGFFMETTPINPHSPYSSSKASADHFVKAFHDTYGMPINITRCSNNYGPYQFPEKLIPLMINNVKHHKQLPVYGDGMQMGISSKPMKTGSSQGSIQMRNPARKRKTGRASRS